MHRPISSICRAVALVVFALPAISSSPLTVLATNAAEPAAVKPADKARPADEKAKSESKPSTAKSAGPKHKPNRLAGETSPYLLLHAHNPVEWYPWGEEALAKAKKEKKLIFLSIGYSSCYWCHVMERESFTDEEIAKWMNEHFVCIKVDREERPDLDEVYMTAVQALGRQGGWPLSVFLTPEAKPFFGGTYFPPRDGQREGHVGFLTVIKRIDEAWSKDRESVQKLADQVADAVKENLEERPAAALTPLRPQIVAEVQAGLTNYYDDVHGGFSFGRTKFPNPSNLLFLLDRAAVAGKATGQEKANAEAAKKMLVHTLDRMAQGGIRDHLGGGFHRYSVDPRWQIPHFEKMLYDNAQLASVYARAYQLTGDAEYRRVTEQLVAFVLREMTDPAGGFYAALDAETDASEGKSYVWTREELQKQLTKDEFTLFAAVYGIAGEPNFEEKSYVPQLAKSLADVAVQRDTTAERLDAQLAPIRAKLLAIRVARPKPLTDTKILTGWNGLMIRGMADAGRILKNEAYVQSASRAAEFALANLRGKDGRLWRTYTAGKAKLNAYQEDYALLADGLIALHEATKDRRWLTAADELTQKQIELFWDAKEGGFFFTSHDHEQLIARRKDAYDGPIPAGNSVAASNLLYLATALDKPAYRDRAEKVLQTLAPRFERAPSSASRAAIALVEFLSFKNGKSGEKK